MTITLLSTSDITTAPGESNGVLEKAIEQFGGNSIWIVSTRTSVGPHDDWWTKLVPGSQTLMNGPTLLDKWKTRIFDHFQSRVGKDIEDDELDDWKEDIEHVSASVPYIVWALMLGIEWPACHGRPAHWVSGLGHLRGKKIIRRRYDVAREPKIRNNTCITCGCASGECECLD